MLHQLRTQQVPQIVFILLLSLILTGCPNQSSGRADQPGATTTPKTVTSPGDGSAEREENPPLQTEFRTRCFSIASGEEIWVRKSGPVGEAFNYEDALVFGNGRWAVGVDPKTGEKLWAQPGRPLVDQPLEDNMVLQIFGENSVRALDATTGKVLWEASYPVDISASRWKDFISFPLQDDEKVVTLDVKTGEKRWETAGRTCATDGERLYVGTFDSVSCFDTDGKEVWTNADLKCFELRGVADGVLLHFGEPAPASDTEGSEDNLAGRTSKGVSTQDGEVLYQLPDGAVWLSAGPKDEGVAHYAIDREHFLIEADTQKTIWSSKFGAPPNEGNNQLDSSPLMDCHPYLYERSEENVAKVRSYTDGEVLQTFPLELSSDYVVPGNGGSLFFVVEDSKNDPKRTDKET